MNQSNSTDRASTFEGRISMVGETVCKQLSLMYIAHTHLRTPEASGFFLKEVAECVNRAMPSDLNEAQFLEAMRDVWRELTALHKTKFWPSIHEISKAAHKASAKINRQLGRQDKLTKAFSGTFEAEQQAKEKDAKPETIEGWLEKLKETDELILSGKLNRGIGITLRRIPCFALQRLGYDHSTSLESMGETPAEHLPEPTPEPTPEPAAIGKPLMAMDEGELDMRLIKAGHQTPKFESSGELIDDSVPDFGAL